MAIHLPSSVAPPMPGIDVLGISRQVVLVLCDSWNSTNGQMRRFELDESGWKMAGPPVPVSLGRNGLAWGRGAFPAQEKRQKREGDGCSPAGVFRLPYVFGKMSSDQAKGIRMPYVQCTSTLECVDDTNSAYYNQIVNRPDIPHPDWHTSEKMLTSDDQYRLGVFVNHNIPAHPGDGSCIFLHVWGAPGKSTSGCTAMALGEMEALVAWLDNSSYPLLVQMPMSEYGRLKSSWHLPGFFTNAP